MIIIFKAKVGREKEFQLALRKLRGKDVDISHEAIEIMVHSKLSQLIKVSIHLTCLMTEAEFNLAYRIILKLLKTFLRLRCLICSKADTCGL